MRLKTLLCAAAVSAAAALVAVLPGGASSVTTGQSTLAIPCGGGVTAPTDWYKPAAAPIGLVWLEHGYLSSKADVAALGQAIASRTGALVVSPTMSSTPTDPCWIDGSPLHQAVARLFVNRAALEASASAAGWTQALPAPFVLVGHSSGGNLAVDVARYLIGTAAFVDLRSVVMLEGASQDAAMTQMRSALAALTDANYRQVLQVGAPPTSCNPDRRGTHALVEARPGQFVGVELVNGNHVDAIGYANFLGNLLCGWPRWENVQAVPTIASSWITNAFTGSASGISGGAPGQRFAVPGGATAVVLPAE